MNRKIKMIADKHQPLLLVKERANKSASVVAATSGGALLAASGLWLYLG